MPKKNKIHENWILINKKENFNFKNIKKINPDFIFIPHWSYIIPTKIFSNFECIVFHMTDLPFGRGGSPLQNLIVLGFEETLISAIRVNEAIDSGPIYLKSKMSLNGSAEEIFIRSGNIIFNQIENIIKKRIQPQPQKGIPTYFKRRKESDGDIRNINDINKLYDTIRMLDADSYPNAFLETKTLKFEFSRASIKADPPSIRHGT